jgi:two-component system, OmpR family, phosphate regulon response regulator OmpR
MEVTERHIFCYAVNDKSASISIMKPNTLPHILVVDDDDRLRELLRRYLSEHGFIVTSASDAADARVKMQSLAFDLMVLDIMMPGESGLEFAKHLRAEGNHRLPVLLLTAMGEPEDRIHGLEAGVDDYLTKPFEPRELVLRISAILRRAPQETAQEPKQNVRFGAYCFDIERQRLSKGDEPVHLTTQEQAILALLAQRTGRPVSREELAQAGGVTGNERSVDVQINRLRKKIEDSAGKPLYIVTARGSGYVLQAD